MLDKTNVRSREESTSSESSWPGKEKLTHSLQVFALFSVF